MPSTIFYIGATSIHMSELTNDPLAFIQLIAKEYGWNWASRLYEYWKGIFPNEPRVDQVWHWLEQTRYDWLEDADHENGKYQCQCCHCNRFFIGHKRRVVCAQCVRNGK